MAGVSLQFSNRNLGFFELANFWVLKTRGRGNLFRIENKWLNLYLKIKFKIELSTKKYKIYRIQEVVLTQFYAFYYKFI